MVQAQFLESVGRVVLTFLEHVGEMTLLLGRAGHWVLRGTFEPEQTLVQLARVGAGSLYIVLITGTFTGMVLAYQAATQLIQFGATSFVGGAVAVSMAREAGPVFTAVTMAGVMGAGFAAEIGTMAVTEQIDALHVLATDPVRYLVIPRFIAGMCMLPILTVFANFMGLAGGLIVGETFGVPSSTYMGSILRFLTTHDYLGGIAKSAIFGGVIALVGSHRGLGTQGGAAGVGVAATSAAVVAIVVILVMNFFLDLVLF